MASYGLTPLGSSLPSGVLPSPSSMVSDLVLTVACSPFPVEGRKAALCSTREYF